MSCVALYAERRRRRGPTHNLVLPSRRLGIDDAGRARPRGSGAHERRDCHHVPTWFDPAETTGVITPFMFLYALHDALVKPMPGNAMAPSLAESWTGSPNGLGYEF